MLTGVYFSRKLERSRILFCYPRRLFLLLLCLFFFVFFFLPFFHSVFSSWLLSFFCISSWLRSFAFLCALDDQKPSTTVNRLQQPLLSFARFFFPSLPHYISFSFHFIACFSLLCLRSSLFYFFPLYDSPLFYVALSRVSSLRYEFFFHSVYSFKTITDEISLRTNSPSILQMYTYIFDMRYSFVSTYLDKSHSPLFTRGNFVKTYCQVISCYQNRLAVWFSAYARVFPLSS